MKSLPILLGAVLLAGTALGQSSPSFKLEEHAFNAGGIQIMTPFYVSDPKTPKIPPSADGLSKAASSKVKEDS